MNTKAHTKILALTHAARSAVSMVLVCALVFACSIVAYPHDAVADDVTISANAGNGWVLSYTLHDGGEASVSGVVTVGSGSLEVPSSVTNGGATYIVTSVGERAFYVCMSLKAIQLPATLAEIDMQAFYGSGLESITIPAGVDTIPYGCFAQCTSLASIDFQAASMLQFDEYAFQNCAFTEFTIPPMIGMKWNIGNYCFADCAKLETVIIDEGNEDGAVYYFMTSTVFNNTPSMKSLVYLCKKGSLSNGTSSFGNSGVKFYYTLDFYENVNDAGRKVNRTGRVVVAEGTKILDIFNDFENCDIYEPLSDTKLPQKPEGKAWGVGGVEGSISGTTGSGAVYNIEYSDDHVMETPDTELDNSYEVLPIDPENLSYAFISSPEIRTYNETAVEVSRDNTTADVDSYYYIDLSGKGCELNDFEVYAADGTLLDSSAYTLKFEYTYTYNDETYYKEVAPEDVEQAGTYQVTATGTGSYANTSATATFYVRNFEPMTSTYTYDSGAYDLNQAALDTCLATEGNATFSVVAPRDNWQYGLIAMGMAGTGNTIVSFIDAADSSSNAYRALLQVKSDDVWLLGTTSDIPSSVDTRIQQTVLSDGGSLGRYSASTPSELAVEMYTMIKEEAGEGASGYNAWGTTALVVSSAECFGTLAVAQYAYANRAPVFFTESDGALGASTLNALSDGGFENILVVGASSEVSTTVELQLTLMTEAKVNRILSSSASAWEKSSELVGTLTDTSAVKRKTVVVADGSQTAAVLAAANYAGVKSSLLYVVNSDADMRKTIAAVEEMGLTSVYGISFYGTFSYVSETLISALKGLWSGDDVPSEELATGDTFEAGGLIYKCGSGGTASLAGVADSALTSVSINSVTYEKVSYKVTSVAAGACAGATLKTVTLGSNATKIGKNAFSGCKKLTKATLKSTKLSSVGANAFKSCKALKNLVVKSTKLKSGSIGSTAFSGTPAKAVVRVPKAKLKAYKKLFVKAGLSKKATFKKC